MLLRWVQPDDTSSFRVSVWSGTLGGGVSEAVYASGMAECGSESTGTGTVWCLEVPAPAGCRALWTVEAVNGAESTWAENGPRTRRCVATCAADLDWSGFVGLSDFNALGAAWGLSCE